MDREAKIQIIDDVFYFVPKPLRWLGRMMGMHDKIIDGTIKDSGDFYEHLPEFLLRLQDADYSQLALEMLPLLEKGTTVEIGCGRGDLMMRLAAQGVKPIYGIDRIAGMVKATRRRLEEFEDAQVFHQKVEHFDFSTLAPIANVIANGFWGSIPPEDSRDLLIELKVNLDPGGKIIIGSLSQGQLPDRIVEAVKKSRSELGFYLSYPLFLDFEECGYRSEKVNLNGGEYSILRPA